MILDVSKSDLVEYNGVQFICSQFVVRSVGKLKIHPLYVHKVDTSLKEITFRIPEDGDLAGNRLKPYDNTVGWLMNIGHDMMHEGNPVFAKANYETIEIDLYVHREPAEKFIQ